ncbi:nuclear transport factor 2 family protein [soil metagenome]
MDLQEISDRLEIADVVTRYTRGIDTGEWDRLDTVFTPDADIDYTESGGIHAGYAEIKPWLAEMLPAFFPKRMHTIGQVEVVFAAHDADPDAAPDAASVVAYFDNPMPMADGAGGEKIVEVGGMYHHEMVRTTDGWRSRKLFEQVIWKRGL